jgi:hypothetical protein
LPVACSIAQAEEIELRQFKETFKAQTGLSDHRIRGFLSWATSGGNPFLSMKELRGKGIHEKWIKVERKIDDEG